MGSAPKAPAAPDPVTTANAQTASNKDTAYWNAVLNNVNQVTPYGNLTYTQTGGGKTYNDAGYQNALTAFNKQQATAAQPNGDHPANYDPIYGTTDRNPNYKAPVAPKREDYLTGDAPPSFTSTINLSPEQQKLLDTQQRSDNSLASLGESQIGRIRDAESTPYSYSGLGDANAYATDAENALYSRLNPQFDKDEEAMRTKLINQGIGQGSEAWNNAYTTFNQAKNDARQQAVLGGQQYGLNARNQEINEYNAQRNAPLNEYTALTSGQQVQNPTFASQGSGGASGTDIAGITNNAYQAALGKYNAATASNNATTSSLFGLGGTLGGSFLGSQAGSAWLAGLSDERLKENITPYGSKNGHNLYQFNYKGIPAQFIGVMAQEVERIRPEAITEYKGYKSVNYAMLGLEMESV